MLSIAEQEELTIAYALVLGGEIHQESYATWWCSCWVGTTKYNAAVKFLEHDRGFYLHTNGTLMAADRTITP